MVDCLTVPLQVPAHAQVVLEGWRRAGRARCPRARSATTPASTRRSSRSRCCTIDCDDDAQRPDLPVDRRRPSRRRRTGRSGKATERIFLPLIKLHRSRTSSTTTCRSAGVLPQLRDRLDRQALPEARAEGDERDLGRAPAVADQADRRGRRRLRRRTTTTRSPGGRSATSTTPTTCCSPQGPVDHLDHASYQQFWGGKAGIDATRKLPERGLHPRRWLAGDDRVRTRRSSAKVDRALEGVRPVSATADGDRRARRSPAASRRSCAW